MKLQQNWNKTVSK